MTLAPKFVDTDTARKMLGNIGKTKLYELMKEGRLARAKIGAKTLISVESIESFSASIMQNAA